MKPSQKLAQIARQELNKIQNDLILQDGEKYLVFGRYTIQRDGQGYKVVNAANNFGRFTSTRSALAWCIADRHNDINLAIRIRQLDSLAERYQADLQVRNLLANRAKTEDHWETIVSKLDITRVKFLSIQDELSKCVNRAKYYQNRGFSNETSRTGRTI